VRVTPFRAGLAGALLLAVGFLVFRAYEVRATESRLSGIASEIAGRNVRVECQGAVGAALDVTNESGSVMFDADGRPADVTHLKRGICKALAAFPGQQHGRKFECLDGGVPCEMGVLKSLHALQTLAHEAWHLWGERSEAATECYALQTVAVVAGRLGASPERAQAAASVVATELYPRMPAGYRSSDCRDGGRLDLHPESAAWP
jgi:hypothetical protein